MELKDPHIQTSLCSFFRSHGRKVFVFLIATAARGGMEHFFHGCQRSCEGKSGYEVVKWLCCMVISH